jgi:hypothetical protein
VSRNRALLNYALVVAATAALFVVIVAVREHTALVSALSAAGTVAAGVFAALAALGSMRAAADSSATARRSQESLARTARPQVRPAVRADGGTLIGDVRVAGQAAVDVTAVWMLVERAPATVRTDRIEPGQAPGLTVDLELPPDTDVASAVRMVWIEYHDAGHLGQWQDTWEVAPGTPGTFRLTDSQLAD